MRVLAGGARVFGADDGAGAADARSRTPICRQSGARQLAQTIREYDRGRGAGRAHSAAEEVLYVVKGRGACHIAGFKYPIEPGSGVYIPAGAAWSVENPSDEPLVVVSVCCPEEPAREVEEPAPSPSLDAEPPRRVLHERDCEAIPSGDRQFKLLVDNDLGCRQVTQFVGFIPPSKAPFHYHTYEEAIYILEGTGVVHTQEASTEFGPGTSIYLPPGARHCLENPGPGTVRLLGVFYPSGSPATRYD
jgi:mannose-6-phosphate isomerase-like protein (cupin superfamily)